MCSCRTLADPATLQVYEVGAVLGYQRGHGGAAETCQGPRGELVLEPGLGLALGTSGGGSPAHYGACEAMQGNFLWQYKAQGLLSVYLNHHLHLKCRRSKWTMLELGSSEVTCEEVPIWLFLGQNLPWEPEKLLVKDLPEAPLHGHFSTQDRAVKDILPLAPELYIPTYKF